MQPSPWITREIIHTKHRIKRLRKNKQNLTQITNLRAQLKLAIREYKKEYFNVSLPGFLIKSGSEMITKKKQMQTVSMCSSSQYLQRREQSKETMSIVNRVLAQWAPLEITQAGIYQQLLALDTKKASGPDGIPSEFLERYAALVSFI